MKTQLLAGVSSPDYGGWVVHSVPSESWRPVLRLQSKPEDMRIMGTPWCRSGLNPKAREPEALMVQVQKTDVPAQAGTMNPSFPGLLVLFRPSKDWAMVTGIGEGDHLYSNCPLKCWSVPEIPAQTHLERVFDELSGHPLAHSSWHMKWTITSTCNTKFTIFTIPKCIIR